MTRLTPIDPAKATGKTKTLLDAVQRGQAALGRTPNMTRVMAQSSAVLEGYLALSGALAKGALSARLREQIALASAEANRCQYCLSAHAAIGKMDLSVLGSIRKDLGGRLGLQRLRRERGSDRRGRSGRARVMPAATRIQER